LKLADGLNAAPVTQSMRSLNIETSTSLSANVWHKVTVTPSPSRPFCPNRHDVRHSTFEYGHAEQERNIFSSPHCACAIHCTVNLRIGVSRIRRRQRAAGRAPRSSHRFDGTDLHHF
jgi:hypothetical protein